MMKKLLISMVILAAGLFRASAYELYIGDSQVTKDGQVNSPAIKSGTVTYQNSTKTLTLSHAVIEATDAHGITNKGIEDLIIKIEGDSTISSTDGCGLFMSYSTTIEGTDFEYVIIQGDGTNCSGIYVDPAYSSSLTSLIFSEVWAYVEGDKQGISTDSSKETELVVRESGLTAKARQEGSSCIKGFSTVITRSVNYGWEGNKFSYDSELVNASGDPVSMCEFMPCLALG